MSRSYLRNKHIKSCWYSSTKNPHRLDEKPKNRISKFITLRDPGAWGYKLTGSRQGHQVRNEGHRIASGIVRAKVKAETTREIQFSLEMETMDSSPKTDSSANYTRPLC